MATTAPPAQGVPDPKIQRRLKDVKHIILVLSGKGGVGKSSVAAQLALSLSSPSPSRPYPSKVALLDIDLTGPSIPRMVGLDGHALYASQDGWVPVYADASQNLAVMSMGFVLKGKNDSLAWRGPKKSTMIKQFLRDVRWGAHDYLIIDTPPGTSDEHITIMECLHPFMPQAVLVTTPQAVSLADNLRSLDFCRKTGLPLVGLIENMSGYVCPHCAECTNVWGRGGGEALAQREGIEFLGRIPIDPKLVRVLDDAREEAAQSGQPDAVANGHTTDAEQTNRNGQVIAESAIPQGTRRSRTVLERYKDSDTFPIFQAITQRVADIVDPRLAELSDAAVSTSARTAQ